MSEDMGRIYLDWDTNAIVTTIVCLLLACLVLFFAVRYRGWARWLMVFVGVTSFLVPMFLFPVSVSGDGKKLTLHFVGHSRELALADYDCTLYAAREGMDGLTRRCASDGFFGYWGVWADDCGTKYTSYVMSQSKEIWLLTFKKNGHERILLNIPPGLME